MPSLVKWITPDSGFNFTFTRVERASAKTGPWTELTVHDNANYTANGLPFPATEIDDENGMPSDWYRICFYDGMAFSDYSDPMQCYSMKGYCTIGELRAFTNLQASEYPDQQLQLIIDGVTSLIDLETNRTWQGIQTITPASTSFSGPGYYDGTNTILLDLHYGDIQGISSISVDTSGDGSYGQALNPSSDVFIDYVSGNMKLSPNAPIHHWPSGGGGQMRRNCIRVAFTYGNSAPSYEVRHLALLMCANHFSVDKSREAKIQRMLHLLRRSTFDTV